MSTRYKLIIQEFMETILEILKVILLGIIQGITEWLPISSTGHMILVDELIHLQLTPQFKEMFFVVIQLGSIMAVVVLYFSKLFPFSKENRKNPKDVWLLWAKVLVAALPAAVLGLLFDDWIDKTFYNYVVVAITLIVYGILFIIVEERNKRKTPRISTLKDLSFQIAFGIGVFQVLALIPGTSRSGATILGAIILGTSRYVAAEFSFFLAIPVMAGASLLKLLKFGFAFTAIEAGALVIGCVVAFIVSILTIRLLLRYIKRHNFTIFGIYRIVLGVIVLLYFFFK